MRVVAVPDQWRSGAKASRTKGVGRRRRRSVHRDQATDLGGGSIRRRFCEVRALASFSCGRGGSKTRRSLAPEAGATATVEQIASQATLHASLECLLSLGQQPACAVCSFACISMPAICCPGISHGIRAAAGTAALTAKRASKKVRISRTFVSIAPGSGRSDSQSRCPDVESHSR